MNNRFIFRYLKSYKAQTALYLVLIFLSIVFTLMTILSLGDFLRLLFPETISQTAAKVNTNALNSTTNTLYAWLLSFGQRKAMLYFSLLLFGTYLLKNVSTYLASRVVVSLRNKVLKDIRNNLFDKVLRLPLSFFGANRKGDIISRFSSDINECDEFMLKPYQQITIAIITILIYLSALFYINYKLTIFVLLVLPFAGFIISRISRKLKNSQKMHQQNAFMLSLIEETISGIRIIKAYTAIDFSNNRFQRYNGSFVRLRNSIYRRVDMASPISDFLGNSIVIGILVFGSGLVLSPTSTLTAPMFLVYLFLFTLNINPAKDLSTGFYNLKKSKAVVARLEEILNTDEVITEKPNAVEVDRFEKNICFNNVSFAYKETEVLQQINLNIEKGKFVALVGPSGAGKSTIADLIARFYDTTQGEIRIDGVNVKDLKLKSLRRLIGFVTQDTILFNDTIFNNIALGMPNATQQQVEEAAKIANVHNFIMEMEGGYQTNIGDRGGNLSGGQRQRLCIARAVLCNPDILILDEATSALDTESERLVQDALAKVMQNRTSVVIAHRLSTIQFADEIIVLENGQIVQRGTHQQLYNREGLYKTLCTMQNFV